jgi:predicted RNase H-like HicB family nuclease
VKYTVMLVEGEEPGRYVAYVPVLGVTTQGEGIEQALARIEARTDSAAVEPTREAVPAD